MPTILQLRRGTTAENAAYTGSAGELTVDTELTKLLLHDGSTAGGVAVGDITSVVAGTGMTGGSTEGVATLNVIGGTGITANADEITIDTSIVTTLTGSQTLTNKTLTSPVLDTAISGTAFLDEDNMASNSATKVASQQSIKAYTDNALAALVDSSPAALNTLNELAAALGDDANFSTTITNAVAAKLSNVVEDTTPQLGGALDANSNNITNLGTLNTHTVPGGTGTIALTSDITTTTINNNADNRIITGSAAADTLNAESGITFSSNRLYITSAGGINCTSVNANNIGNNEFLSLRGGTETGGVKIQYFDGSLKNAVLVDDENNVMSFDINVGIKNTSPTEALDVTGNITASGTISGTFTGNITGDVTGNADTATTLETARTIAGQSFDGSSNITIA